MNKIQLQRLKEYSYDLKKTEESTTMKCTNCTAWMAIIGQRKEKKWNVL